MKEKKRKKNTSSSLDKTIGPVMLESLKPISPGWWWVRTCCCARAVPTSVKVGRPHLSIELWGEFVFFFLCVFLILLPVKIESFSAYVMFMYELVSCLLTRV